jgi:hypothetical protein
LLHKSGYLVSGAVDDVAVKPVPGRLEWHSHRLDVGHVDTGRRRRRGGRGFALGGVAERQAHLAFFPQVTAPLTVLGTLLTQCGLRFHFGRKLSAARRQELPHLHLLTGLRKGAARCLLLVNLALFNLRPGGLNLGNI